jgi:hypothetical protein
MLQKPAEKQRIIQNHKQQTIKIPLLISLTRQTRIEILGRNRINRRIVHFQK